MNPVKSNARYDAVVIGAGHNGLVAAGYLAKAGLKVIVVERRAILGGAAATEELIPGHKFNTGSNDAGLFHKKILADLEIDSSAVEFIRPPAVVHVPLPGDSGLTLWRDPQQSIREIERYSARDAAQVPHFLQQINRFAAILEDVLMQIPPALPKYHLSDVLPWIPIALKTRQLGRTEMREFMRILPMPVSDFLDEWFETPILKSAIGYSGVIGFFQGPRASGSTFQLLYQAVNAGDSGFRSCEFIRGGMGVLSGALMAAAQKYGAEICMSSPVTKIILDAYQRVESVSLANGERISCRYILCSANPTHALMKLVGAENLPLKFVREVKNIRYRGSTSRIHLVLNQLPEFGKMRDTNVHLSGHILICPDLTYLERAFDSAKYGEYSPDLCLDILLPTMLDPSLAPTGTHHMSIDVRYTPYSLRRGHWDEQRERLCDVVTEIIEKYDPGFGSRITHRTILTPLDYEREYGLPEGSIYHGQMSLDQLLFMRPVAGSQGGLTPLPGLMLCGAGIHPGGGVTGLPGYHAARQVMKSFG